MSDSVNDLVIGAAVGYSWPDISPFAISLSQSGFAGKKVLLSADLSEEAVTNLTRLGYELIPIGPLDSHLNVQRFLAAWRFLCDSSPFRHVIFVDVGDLIFQSNPSSWLEENLGPYPLAASSEFIRYRDEPWGKDNMLQSFGEEVYSSMQDEISYCAGTIAGDAETVASLFLNIYLLSKSAGTPKADQAAYNLLVHHSPYKQITVVPALEDGFALMCGTVINNPALFSPGLIVHDLPRLDEANGLVFSPGTGRLFAVVHQYDRIPHWKEIIRRKYNGI